MAFPEQGQACSVAFAFRWVHGGGVIGEGGPDLVTVDRLGDRCARVPDQVAELFQADITSAEDGHNRVP